MKKALVLLSLLGVFGIANAGDMAVDGYTGLTWQDNKEIVDNLYTYDKAYKYCDALVLGGHDDWRIPKIAELLSLVNYLKYKPAIINGFNVVDDRFYWSSTIFKGDTIKNWGVDFKDGTSSGNGISYDRRVRCVRVTNPTKIK